jgi:hypothetical protein
MYHFKFISNACAHIKCYLHNSLSNILSNLLNVVYPIILSLPCELGFNHDLSMRS